MPARVLEREADLAQKLAQQPKKHFRRFPKKNEDSLRRTHFSQKLVRLLSRGAKLIVIGYAQKNPAETVRVFSKTPQSASLDCPFPPPIRRINPPNRSASCNEFHRCFDGKMDGEVDGGWWVGLGLGLGDSSRRCGSAWSSSTLLLYDQRTPRGNVLRCPILPSSAAKKMESLITVPDKKLTWREFYRLISGFVKWGMWIKFVPEEVT
jgi:hypothetical protein